MSFLESFVDKYAAHHFKGRAFAVYSDLVTDGYIVKDHATGQRAVIPRRLIMNIRANPNGVARELAAILDAAFDTRTEEERLPWQLFALGLLP
jgi:hypothetical protein